MDRYTTTEKPIKEDFTLPWKPIYFVAGLVLLAVLVAFSLPPYTPRSWHFMAFGIGFAVCILWFIRFALRTSLQNLESGPKWLLSDDGLVRLYSSDLRETIPWEQIQDIRWLGYVGLLIQFKDPNHHQRSREFKDEFRRCRPGVFQSILRLPKNAAIALLQDPSLSPAAKRQISLATNTARTRLVRGAKIFLPIGILIGIAFVIWGTTRFRLQQRSLQWPTATGIITQSELRTHVLRRGSEDYAAVAYTYEVQGIRRTGNQIALWSTDLRHRASAAFVKSHPVRSSVTVYYDPDHPETAVLIPGANKWDDECLIAAGIAVVVVAGLGLLLNARRGSPRVIGEEKAAG